MKLAPDGHTSTAQLGQPGGQPTALLHEAGDAGLHLVGEVERQRRRQLLGRIEVVGQHDLLEVGHDGARPDEVAEPSGRHRPRLREGAGDDERLVVVDQAERRPRGELPVGLVHHEQRVGVDDQVARTERTVASSSTTPVGLFGEQRNTTEGRAVATTRATSARSVRKSAAALTFDDGACRSGG